MGRDESRMSAKEYHFIFFPFKNARQTVKELAAAWRRCHVSAQMIKFREFAKIMNPIELWGTVT